MRLHHKTIFPYEYIDTEVNKKLEKTKDNLQASKWKGDKKLNGISQTRSQMVNKYYLWNWKVPNQSLTH